MTAKFEDYTKSEIQSEDGTPGGTTFIVAGKRICFAYTRSHIRAVRALTGGKSSDHRKVVDGEVDDLLRDGVIRIDDDDCQEGYGWLGCHVFDPEGDWIGDVGARCTQVAGFRTDHQGYGRCRLHGGAKIANRVLALTKSLHTSEYLKNTLQKKIESYMGGPNPLDLHKELATLRALHATAMEMVIESGDEDVLLHNIPMFTKYINQVGTMVNRIVSIDQKHALTAGQVLYLQNAVTEAFNLFIDDPVIKERAVLWLADRLGTKSLVEAGVSLDNRALQF